jgi:predicted nuclease of predicted toxin-antitoxin system
MRPCRRAWLKVLREDGYDAVHVRDYGMQSAQDETIFASAREQDRILVTADTDFEPCLQLERQASPRLSSSGGQPDRRPERQLALLLSNLSILEDALERGSVVVIEQTRIRVRSLPVGGR